MNKKLQGTTEDTTLALLSTASIIRHSLVAVLPLSGTITAMLLCFNGLIPGWIELILFGAFYGLNILGMELALHRYFAHKSFKTSQTMHKGLAIIGSLAYMGPIIWWVALHHLHHKFSDQEGDPHSPQPNGPGITNRLKGLVHGHVGWLFDSRTARPKSWNRNALDLYRDPMVLKMHLAYDSWLILGLLIPALVGGLLHWSLTGLLLGFLWGGTVRVFCATNAIWAVNSLAHSVGGTRPFINSGGSSRNIFWLAIMTLGAGWHNNHHAFPRCATTSLRWWQIDISGYIIRLFEKLGFIWDVKWPNKEAIEKKRHAQSNPAVEISK